MKQLEATNNLVHDATSEIAYLKEKVCILEMSMVRQKDDLEQSEHHAPKAREEASELRKKVDSLVCDFETVTERKIQAMENEKLTPVCVQTLLEGKKIDLQMNWKDLGRRKKKVRR